jgi:hypothetical protein
VASKPQFFIDRSLGRIEVARLLREAGLQVITLAEHYGMPRDQDVADVEWIEECSRNQWIALMKDARIRRRPAEKQAVIRRSVRCFCLARADLTSAEMARRYIANVDRILAACTERGPYIYAVHAKTIRRLDL